jgi:hypothetical protein
MIYDPMFWKGFVAGIVFTFLASTITVSLILSLTRNHNDESHPGI